MNAGTSSGGAEPAEAGHQVRRYDPLDVELLEIRAGNAVDHDRFCEYESLSPHAAHVLRNGGGSIYGLSLDAAVREFDNWLRLK